NRTTKEETQMNWPASCCHNTLGKAPLTILRGELWQSLAGILTVTVGIELYDIIKSETRVGDGKNRRNEASKVKGNYVKRWKFCDHFLEENSSARETTTNMGII
ncbi:hypothetical protein H5410_036123, partial [Solanum commersonii]